MALITPNPNGSGDGLDDDLTDGDIVLRDEDGNEIHFQSLEWEDEIAEEENSEKDEKNKQTREARKEKLEE